MMVRTMHSPAETWAFGKRLGQCLTKGDIVILTGDLGSGKTLLVKGIASSLGISEDEVTSPTFALIHEHYGRIPLYHFDVYRLERPSDFEDLGYEEYFFGDGVSVVEWGERVAHYVPKAHLQVSFAKETSNSRRLALRGGDEHYQNLLHRLEQGGC